MIRALVTGVAGFCGGHLVRRLGSIESVRLLGVDVLPERPRGYRHEYAAIDLCDGERLTAVIRGWKPDWVFHLAGTMRGSELEIYRVNLLGSVQLLEALRVEAPGARILVVGSAAEYGPVSRASLPVSEEHPCRPVGAYGISKHAATLATLSYAAQFGMQVVVARPFNIVGPGMPPSLVVGAILKRAKSALAEPGDVVVAVGNTDSERDFVSVRDVVRAYVSMVQGEHWGEVFNICSGRGHVIRALLEQLLSNSPRPIRLAPDPTLWRPDDTPAMIGNGQKALRAFGFTPTVPVEEELRQAWEQEFAEEVPCGLPS